MNGCQKTFRNLLRPYRVQILWIVLALFAASLLALSIPLGLKLIVDNILAGTTASQLAIICGILLALAVLRVGVQFFRKWQSYVVAERVVCDLRTDLYEHIQRISLLHFKKMPPSDIMPRMTSDVETIRRFILNDVVETLFSVISLLVIIFVLCRLSWVLTVSALALFPLFLNIYLSQISSLKQGYLDARTSQGNFLAKIQQVLYGVAVVRAFAAEDQETDRFSKRQNKLFSLVIANHTRDLLLWGIIDGFSLLGTILVLFLGGVFVIKNQMTIGGLMAFYSCLGMMYSPLLRLVMANNTYQDANAALGRVNEIFSAPIEKQTNEDAGLSPQKIDLLKFEELGFSYENGRELLQGISFSVKKGEMIGIVGLSGEGKTTLINLLLGFYHPQSGRIWINDQDLIGINAREYRLETAVVLQDDWLFDGTVKENIIYPSLSGSMPDVIDAARRARAHDFIQQLPAQYDTPIGEAGVLLSAGQRQRISLARALMRDPQVLILDEATSAVDAAAERDILESLFREKSRRITIIVAHKFTSIMQCDRIYVIHQGKIFEEGSHDELLNQSGQYARLFYKQFPERLKQLNQSFVK